MAAILFVFADKKDRAVLYRGHVMPMQRGEHVPVVVDKPVHRFSTPEEEDLIRIRFDEEHCAYWREDGVYKFPDGIWARERTTEQWMTDFTRDFLPLAAFSWDMVMLREFLKGTSALYAFNSCAHGADADLSGFVTIDVDKCYWRTALALGTPGSQFYGALPKPDPFIQSVSGYHVSVADMMDPKANAWYGILPDCWCDRVQRLLGINSNLVSILEWRELYRFFDNDTSLKPDRVWKFEGKGWPLDAINEMQNFDNAHRKGFASVIGLCNDAIKVRTRELELPVEFKVEREHYARMYGMTAYANTPTIIGRKEQLNPRNRAHYRIAVIHTANAYVLQWINSIRDKTGELPVKIKTDGLMYKASWFKDEARSHGHDLDVFIRDYFAPGWKLEVPNKPALCAVYAFQYVDLDATSSARQAYMRNHVYTGAPGTGKTYSALKDGRFDFITTMSNRNAVRLGGQTLYKLFRVVPGQEAKAFLPFMCERFRNKRIFVDEAQQIPRLWYTLFMYLFHHVNANFVFAMDTDQLAPVSNFEGPIQRIPFHGKHIHLTVDHRNDVAIQRARMLVLKGEFTPSVVLPGCFDPQDYTDLNVCAHVNTRVYVNQEIVKAKGLRFGDPGRYIVNADNSDKRKKIRALELQQSQMLTVLPGTFMVFVDSERPAVVYDFRNIQENLRAVIDFGFCITAHSLIGSTIRDKMTIWDWDSVFANNTHGVLYTAITRACRLEDIVFRNEPPQCRAARAKKRNRA